jgi:hypothetical protein
MKEKYARQSKFIAIEGDGVVDLYNLDHISHIRLFKTQDRAKITLNNRVEHTLDGSEATQLAEVLSMAQFIQLPSQGEPNQAA